MGCTGRPSPSRRRRRETYLSRLEDAVVSALEADVDADQPPGRLVIHLGKRTHWREIEAVRRAMTRAGVALPALFMRLDDSHLYDIADGRSDTRVPPKGLAVRLGPNRILLQAEGAGPPPAHPRDRSCSSSTVAAMASPTRSRG